MKLLQCDSLCLESTAYFACVSYWPNQFCSPRNWLRNYQSSVYPLAKDLNLLIQGFIFTDSLILKIPFKLNVSGYCNGQGSTPSLGTSLEVYCVNNEEMFKLFRSTKKTRRLDTRITCSEPITGMKNSTHVMNQSEA